MAEIGTAGPLATKTTSYKGTYLMLQLPLLSKTVDPEIRGGLPGRCLGGRCTSDFYFYCPQVKHHYEEVQ